MVSPDVRKLLSSSHGGVTNLQSMSASQLADRLKLLKDAIREAQGSSSDNRFRATTFNPRAGRKSFGAYGVSEQVEEVLEAEEQLRELLNLDEAGDSAVLSDGGCSDNDPCGDKRKVINLEDLAEVVFAHLRAEILVERERVGWTY